MTTIAKFLPQAKLLAAIYEETARKAGVSYHAAQESYGCDAEVTEDGELRIYDCDGETIAKGEDYPSLERAFLLDLKSVVHSANENYASEDDED